MNFSGCCIIVNNIYSELLRCWVRCQDRLVLDVISACQEIYFSSHICEVVDYVDILVCWYPSGSEIDLHGHEIEAILPVNFVFFPCHYRESPCSSRLKFHPKREISVILNISYVGLLCYIIHSSHYRIVILKDSHRLLIKDVW
jgi:hypothetical protein